MEAVVELWKPMNGSSVESLRGTFLQRKGKLSNNYSYELFVEVKGIDFLLAQLPWRKVTIKTPLMQGIIILFLELTEIKFFFLDEYLDKMI